MYGGRSAEARQHHRGRRLGLLVLSLLAPAPAPAAVCGHALDAALRPAAAASLPSKGRLRAVVIFARFLGEEGPSAAPSFAADLFDPGLPGSLSHFFHEMSRGQFRLEGEALPKVYTSAGPASAYLAGDAGLFGNFSRQILAAADADPDVDFRRFDDDGPDRLPDSGDDDGYVDLVLIVVQSTPTGFIRGDANGVASLGLATAFRTSDTGRSGFPIRVRADSDLGGTLQRGRSFGEAAGIIAHEIAHLLGLPDLYDLDVRGYDPASELDRHSGGIGYWGLMAHGARGWNDSNRGPNPFCAWSLRQLGWLGQDNERLVKVAGSLDGAPLADVHRGGRVYEMPVDEGEYLLVEHRSAAGSHYDRDLPASGVLIWHVQEAAGSNDVERRKLVDLVCADGRYTDAGFPLGTQPSASLGADNLDFWSLDADYNESHAGNLGDATDPYDGVRFTELSPLTNPALNGVNVNRIRPTADGFAADLTVEDRRRAGLVRDPVWRDTVEIVGDVRVPAGSDLHIEAGTVVLVAPDGLGAGTDPGRGEIVVDGGVTSTGPVLFASASPRPAPGDWGGIQVSASGGLDLHEVVIEHATDGLTIQGAGRHQDLSRVEIREPAGTGLLLESVDGPVRLHGVEVTGAGGPGIAILGGAPVEADDLSVRHSGKGLVCEGGFLFLSGSDLRENGPESSGPDLVMGNGARGTINGNRFAGSGLGLHLSRTEAVLVEGNDLAGYRLALRTTNAAPRILRNRFVQVDTVVVAEGFPVPLRLQLNTVVEAGVLVVNTTPHRIDARRNWWGTAEAGEIEAGMTGPVDWTPFLNSDPRQPVGFELAQNYPNPFVETTVIEFSVPPLPASLGGSGPLTLEVRTLLGGLVRRLLDQEAAPGVFQIEWDGRDERGLRAASGYYYCELFVGGLYLRRRMLLLR